MPRKLDSSSQSLFKKVILEMPDGYYSGDRPNPNLKGFVEQHNVKRPYDPNNDSYAPPPFNRPIEATKATAIYNMHTYWSKKPHDAIRQYIRHYTKPGDLVLDPFCGSGGTALAALIEGRDAIAIDRSPAATFITKNYCTPVDISELERAFGELKKKVEPEIDWLYKTRCDRCGGNATTAYTVYSQVFECPRCLEKVPLFDCVELEGETANGKHKKISACPRCQETGVVEEIRTRATKFGSVPVLTSYLCQNGCSPARGERRHNDSNKKKREYFEKYDLGKIREIESKDIPHWYPRNRMMNAPETQECWGVKWRAGTSNFRTVDELFTKRNLWALASLREALEGSPQRDTLLFAFTGICLGFSKMCQWIPEASYPFPMMRGTYYMPPISKEQRVLHYYENRISLIRRAAEQISIGSALLLVSTQDVRDLTDIPSFTVDYIFTDPPYAEKVQYGELNFIWEAWLGLDTHWHDQEIIVNEVRGKDEEDWGRMMRQAMAECYRVLKPGRCVSLCYHDTSEGTWALVQDIMAETGFIVEKSDAALYIDTDQKSYNQLLADKVNKRDLVVNFRKPKLGEVATTVAITGKEDKRTFNEKVRQIICDYLGSNPGQTKDRIYDELVSCMLRSGQMESHDFDALLNQVAEEVKTPIKKDLFQNEDPTLFGTHEVRRWYLKDTELAVADVAETTREDAAAKNLTAFIQKYLKAHPDCDGVHYSNLFEHYVYSVKDKPRRQLADFLPDYFYKTEVGTWRLAGSVDEERAKADVRTSGLGRRVKHYIAQLEHSVVIQEHERPNDATLAEWIRHCKRGGLYEQGKLLYEKGGLNPNNLPEEAKASVEEDYQICARMMARQEETGPVKKPRRIKE